MLKSVLWLSLACATPSFAQDASDSPTHPERARVEVHKGRCVLLAEGKVERTLRSGATGDTAGRTHAEIAAGSEVRLSWPGRASVYVWGPASLQWSTDPTTSTTDDATSTFSSESLTIQFFDIAWCDFEVRRGQHRLRLPGHWRCDVENGATHFRGLPQGPVEVRHHAGSPLTLVWEGDLSKPRPPVTVYSGSSVRLDMPTTSPDDRSSKAPSWGQSQWPWREQADTDDEIRDRVALQGRTNQPGSWPSGEGPQRGTMARVPEFTERTGVKVDVQPETMRIGDTQSPQSQSTPMSPYTGRTAVQNPGTTLPELPPTRVQPKQPKVQDAPAVSRTFLTDQWGGLGRHQLESSGVMAIERSQHVEIRLFSSGRRKVFVASECSTSIRCFGPNGDYTLEPGTVAVFEKDGSLKSAYGDYEASETPTNRPTLGELN
tara:strand:+ start:3844 stop:5139 length:1296 start_codon:yes stop_codon:yes gene_type:complete